MNQPHPFTTFDLSKEFDRVDSIRLRCKQLPERRKLALAFLYGFLKRSTERDYLLSEGLVSLETRVDEMEAVPAAGDSGAVLGDDLASVPDSFPGSSSACGAAC